MRHALLLVVSVSACGGSEPAFCDIRSSGCRERTYRAVLEARGDAWDAWSASPPSEVITVPELRQRLEAGLPSTPPAPTLWDRADIVLDLRSAATDPAQAGIDDFVTNVAAFYSPSSGRVTIIDRGIPADATTLRRNTFVLAHELTHFVQDRDRGLSRFTAAIESSDLYVARKSLVEGEAVLYSNLVIQRIEGRDPHHARWNGYYDDMLTAATSSLASAANRLDSGMMALLYPVGGRLVTDAYLAGGNLAVRALWSHPAPDSLAMVMPYGTTPPSSEDLTCPAPTSPPAATQGGRDRLGAVGLYVLAADRWIAATDAWALVPAWRDDRLWAYTTATGTVAIWRARFATGTDLGPLVAGIQSTSSAHEVRVELVGQEVTLAATDQTGLLDSWTGWRCNH